MAAKTRTATRALLDGVDAGSFLAATPLRAVAVLFLLSVRGGGGQTCSCVRARATISAPRGRSQAHGGALWARMQGCLRSRPCRSARPGSRTPDRHAGAPHSVLGARADTWSPFLWASSPSECVVLTRLPPGAARGRRAEQVPPPQVPQNSGVVGMRPGDGGRTPRRVPAKRSGEGCCATDCPLREWAPGKVCACASEWRNAICRVALRVVFLPVCLVRCARCLVLCSACSVSCVCIHVSVCERFCMRVRARLHVRACEHAIVRAFVRVCTRACMLACLRACMRVHRHVWVTGMRLWAMLFA